MKYQSFIALCGMHHCRAYTFHLTSLPKDSELFCPSCGILLTAIEPHRLRDILNTLPEPVRAHVVRTYEAEGLLTPALRLVGAESAEIDAEYDEDDEGVIGDNAAPDPEHPDFAAIREAWCGVTWDGERWADVSTNSSIMVHREGHLTAHKPESGAEWAEKWSEWRAVELRETVLSLCHNGMRVGVARSMRQILGFAGLCTLEELVAANGGPVLSPDELALLEAPAHASWSDAPDNAQTMSERKLVQLSTILECRKVVLDTSDAAAQHGDPRAAGILFAAQTLSSLYDRLKQPKSEDPS